ncbi:unnamed protein product [Echinostoma caproni]|uniref:CNH domain-containing protein n=1 Tax=Echinostoma caproni TaxID=27848 RepID=A0A183A9A4_9TREM|nr:unnamed protein product [Echinostoma caproni]
MQDAPIAKIDCCASINLLTILSDHTLTLCDAEQLERVGFNLPCRDVVTFNLNTLENETAKLSLAFSSKRIHIYLLTTTSVELVFDILLNFVPKSLCVTTNFLGVVVSNQYLSVNLHTKAVTELLQFDPTAVRAFIRAVTKDVFLIAGPGSLGVIVDATGTSQRPPIQMSPNVLDVFVWKDYVYTVTDEFFTIHSLLSQTQLQTVPLNNATSACFASDAMHFVFVGTWLANCSKADLVAIGPERWDQFARKLILADCMNEARRLLADEKHRLNILIQQRPASSKNEQNIFVKRSRRLFGLLGFYHFEKGDFKSAQMYFEKAVVDIRELLYRYEDLLPKGYTFEPDPFYILCAADPIGHDQMSRASTTGVRSVTDLCLLHTLTEASRLSVSKSDDASPDPEVTSQWLVRYDKFLFDFLQKHHKSKFTEASCHRPSL